MLRGLSSLFRLTSRSRGPKAAAARRDSSTTSPRRGAGASAGGPGRRKDASEVPDDSSSGSLTPDVERPSARPAGVAPWQIEARQQEEKDFIRQNDTAEAHFWYLVDVHWLHEWKQFVTRNGPMPGPLDNRRLVDERGEPYLGLQAVQDYRGVNRAIWHFWHSRYGGGPAICRRQLDLYTAPIDDPESPPGAARLDVSLPGAAPPARAEAARAERAEQERRPAAQRGAVQPTVPPEREEMPVEASPSTASRRGIGLGSTASSRAAAPAGRRTAPRPAEEPEPAPAPAPAAGKVALCCDKCDGPHETEKCPHFKRARERHQDAWAAYGKSKGAKESSGGDGAPVVRNARVVPQPPDGSCLFHSLSYGLSDRSTASSLRRDICGYIAKNPDMKIADTAIKDWIHYDSNDSVQTYAQRMAGGTWGGGIEMAALTHMRSVNVHVYEKCCEGYRRISAFDCPNARKTINVLYQGRMHYDAMIL